MISRTKYPISNQEIRFLCERAGIGTMESAQPLGAGEYNAVYLVLTSLGEYVLKIAPPESIPVMTYEQGMMNAEIFWYEQMREHSNIRVPRIIYADVSKSVFPAEFFFMERVPGKQLNEMDFSEEEKAAAAGTTARMAAELHRIKGDRFGYLQMGLHDDWYQAYRAIIESLVADGKRRGRKSRRGERLLRYIDQYSAVLKQAPCCMVNFDIWAPNILCERTEAGVQYAWIDPERSFWGDAIWDFICLELFTPLAQKKKSLNAYNDSTDVPVLATREENIRYAFAQAHMGLIMEIEKYYRYTPHHRGWWRNVYVSGFLFRHAFDTLKQA